MASPPPPPPLSPYTTLFRSGQPDLRRYLVHPILPRRCGLRHGLARFGPAHRAEAAEDRTAEEGRSEEHTSELQSRGHLVCRLLLEKKKTDTRRTHAHAGCTV